MKQITLQIPDQEYAFFMELIQRLNFVEVTETPSAESKRPLEDVLKELNNEDNQAI